MDIADEALVRQAQAGDGEAAERLCERYKDLVRGLARPYFLLGGDRDDLLQEGMIGLYNAILGYAPERGAPFRSFAELCITRRILSAVKMAARNKHLPLNNYVSLSGRLTADPEDQRQLMDALPLGAQNPEDTFLQKEADAYMQSLLQERLSPFEKQVVELFLSGLRYQQIAEALSCSRKSVDNALQRVRRKIAEAPEEGR